MPKYNANDQDEVAGAGLGYVSVFDMQGTRIRTLVSRGDLNAPWGLAIAPASWKNFAGDLLVGNFGDGTIHAYDATTGEAKGVIKDASNNPVKLEGLWALVPSPVATQSNRLYFTSAPDEEQHGLVGYITVK